MLPIWRPLLPPGGESGMWQSQRTVPRRKVIGQTQGYPHCKKLRDQGRGIAIDICPQGLL